MLFLFQLAKEGINREIYRKLIAPIKHDLPTTNPEGYNKICSEHKYAFFGTNILKTKFSLSIPCKVIPLPGFSYMEPWAFIMSKNNPYKGLINRR
jgi:hypothetical protein